MPRITLEYPKTPYSTVHRDSDRASYTLHTIHSIVNDTPLLHVSFAVPDVPFPAVLPMIGQMGSFARPSAGLGDVLDLYVHGYVSSRIMNVTRKADSSPADETPPGLPVTVAAAQVDGLVLALTPYAHSYNYRSAVLFGHATVVTDPDEKTYALQLITDGVVPGAWDGARVPPKAAEMQSTSVLRIRIQGGSAKMRVGPPNDDRADLADDALRARVWTGVVPVHPTLGTPVAAPHNRAAAVSRHVTDFCRDTNAAAQELALEAAQAKK